MAKVPAFQFYPADWMRDTQLQMASASSRGIWINLLCAMWWAPTRGKLTGTVEDLKKLANCTAEEMLAFLEEVKRYVFANVTERHTRITVMNRRMTREEKSRISNRLRQSRFRSRLSNAKVTSSSPNTPSTASPKKELHCEADA